MPRAVRNEAIFVSSCSWFGLSPSFVGVASNHVTEDTKTASFCPLCWSPLGFPGCGAGWVACGLFLGWLGLGCVGCVYVLGMVAPPLGRGLVDALTGRGVDRLASIRFSADRQTGWDDVDAEKGEGRVEETGEDAETGSDAAGSAGWKMEASQLNT